ncbi:unnamed protein product, partial [Didymodactylos carnosus]
MIDTRLSEADEDGEFHSGLNHHKCPFADGQIRRSSSPSNTSFNSSSRKRSKNMNRYSQQQQRRAKQQIKKVQATIDGEESKEELSERLEKRRNRFNNDEQQQSENTTEQASLVETVKEFKPIQAPDVAIPSSQQKTIIGTCQKLEKNYLRLTS